MCVTILLLFLYKLKVLSDGGKLEIICEIYNKLFLYFTLFNTVINMLIYMKLNEMF